MQEKTNKINYDDFVSYIDSIDNNYHTSQRVQSEKDGSKIYGTRYVLSKKLSDEQKKELGKYSNVIISQASHRYAPEITYDSVILVEKLKQPIVEDLSQPEQSNYAFTTLVNDLIKDELEAIDGYNSAIVTFELEGKGEFTDVIRDIISEENKHIGQLQSILERINPKTTTDIEEGQKEGQEQIEDTQAATEGENEETKVTLDTEEGVAKHWKLDKVEPMK